MGPVVTGPIMRDRVLNEYDIQVTYTEGRVIVEYKIMSIANATARRQTVDPGSSAL